MRTHTLTPHRIVFALALSVACTPLATAQRQVRRVSHQQQGKFVDGLVQNLTDSFNFNQQTPLNTERAANLPELEKARQLISRFAQDTQRLIQELRVDERYSPTTIRPLLADAIQVRAASDVLARRSPYMTAMSQFTHEYEAIDREWRLLAHRLRQTSNIRPQVIQEVDRLNQYSQALSTNYDVAPQIQRQELIHHFVSLQSDLEHLAEDIYYELYGNNEREQLYQRTNNMQRVAAQMSWLVERGYDYAQIKSTYERYFQDWLKVKERLRMVNNRHIQRNVSRVGQINDRLHELLLLKPVIDGNDIQYLANSLKTNIDVVCDDISLSKLISHPNASQIFAASREFYTLCDQFRGRVGNSELDNIRWDFREVDVAWNDLRNLINVNNDPGVARQVASIDSAIMELRQALGEQSSINRQEIQNVASTLDNMTDLLFYDFNQYIGQSNRYRPDFRSQSVNAAKALQSVSHSLYQTVAQNGNEAQIRQLAVDLARRWADMQRYLQQIPNNERGQIAQTAGQIAPALAKLQVLYTY